MTLRDNIRNYLYPMTFEEMQREFDISIERKDTERAKLIEEYINECKIKDAIVRNITPEKLDEIQKALENDEPGTSYGSVEIDDELRKDSSGDSSTNL